MTDASISCDEVQLRLVNGEEGGVVASHLDGCEECRFVASISRDLRPGSTQRPVFDAALDALVNSGGPLLGRYRLRKLLGSGGQGRVYLAEDLETGDSLALKVARLPDEPIAPKALEVAHARRVSHPNVCRVQHAEGHGPIRIIAME